MAVMSWTNFFFVSHFCYLEKISSIQIAQDPQKMKAMGLKFIKVQDLSKRNSERNVRLHRPTATRRGS